MKMRLINQIVPDFTGLDRQVQSSVFALHRANFSAYFKFIEFIAKAL
jgi:hypothetical protein